MIRDERVSAFLAQIEKTEHVRILFAVEAGSRVWGFSSVNSDWDVRFLYLRSPEWYLSIRTQRDVLEYPLSHDGLDVSGWDLRKALGLFYKSNPPLIEWIQSPIIYHQAYSAVPRLLDLVGLYFSPRSCLYHYLGMSEGNYREYLQGNDVHVKKYFYVLRPILACRWIQSRGTIPPLELDLLLKDQLPDQLQQTVADLLDRKRSGDELAMGPRIPQLNQFLDAEIRRLRVYLTGLPKTVAPGWEALDHIFRSVLVEAWPGVKL